MLNQEKKEAIYKTASEWHLPYAAKDLAIRLICLADPNETGDVSDEEIAEIAVIVRDVEAEGTVYDGEAVVGWLQSIRSVSSRMAENRAQVPYGFENGSEDSLYTLITQAVSAFQEYPEFFEAPGAAEELYTMLVNAGLPPWSWIVSAVCRFYNIKDGDFENAYSEFARNGDNDEVIESWQKTADEFAKG